MVAPQSQRVKAVIINCNGAINVDGEPRYITTEVDRNHTAFQQTISPLSRLLKFPIRLMSLPTGYLDTSLDSEHTEYKTNQHAQSLMPQLHGADIFGVFPTEWKFPPGSVLAVSADGGDLKIVPLGIVVDFASTRVMSFLSSEEERAPWTTVVRQEFTPLKF
jgi:hypothetical protein